MIILYRGHYLHMHTISNIQQLYTTHENRHNFPRMLSSIHCMHWGSECVLMCGIVNLCEVIKISQK